MDKETILEVENLQVVFNVENGGQKRILDDVDLLLKKGNTLGIVGESGSGKTQTVFSVLGIHVQEPGMVKGAVKLLDKENSNNTVNLTQKLIKNTVTTSKNKNSVFYHKNIKRWNKGINKVYILHQIRGKKIFIMFQDPKSYLNPFWTVKKHFSKIVKPLLKKGENFEKVMSDALNKFKLPLGEIIYKYPHELSGGMNQRVMIALGYACKPDIIIADEITTGLDIVNQVAVIKHLKDIQKECQLSIILISHDIGFISKLADDILVMYNGQGMEFGPSEVIFNLSEEKKHPYTKELLEIFYETHDKGYISGEPPKREEIISGCRFHKRCPVFQNAPDKYKCDEIPPKDFTDLKKKPHQVRCKIYE